tara:strand:- start:243 stop:542 length:300 start_codon:yes stop_codon:yes gene_type:complete
MESVNGLYLKHDVLYISKKLNVPVGAIISHLVKEKKINKRSEAKGYAKYIKTAEYLGKVQANANRPKSQFDVFKIETDDLRERIKVLEDYIKMNQIEKK